MMGGFAELQRPFLALYQRFLFGETASLTLLDAINGSTVPVFVIHGNADDTVSYSGSAIVSRAEAFTKRRPRLRRKVLKSLWLDYETSKNPSINWDDETVLCRTCCLTIY